MLPESTLQAAFFPARPDEFPIDVAIVPGLAARVYLHALSPPSGPVWCWTYVTQALRESLASGRSMMITGQHGKMSLSVEFTRAG